MFSVDEATRKHKFLLTLNNDVTKNLAVSERT